MGLTEFLAQNKRSTKIIDYVVSDEILGEDGKPAVWKLKTIPAKEDRALRETCTKTIRDKTGRPVTQAFNQNEYLSRLVAKCVVEPDLNNVELQNAYGVMTDFELLEALLESGEFARLANKVQEINNYTTMNEKVEEAKN